MEARRSENPKRKRGTISGFSQPSRGAQGVRQYHKLNEEKILPHRRAGINELDIDTALPAADNL